MHSPAPFHYLLSDSLPVVCLHMCFCAHCLLNQPFQHYSEHGVQARQLIPHHSLEDMTVAEVAVLVEWTQKIRLCEVQSGAYRSESEYSFFSYIFRNSQPKISLFLEFSVNVFFLFLLVFHNLNKEEENTSSENEICNHIQYSIMRPK